MVETMRMNETLRENADRKERKRKDLEKDEILGISSRRRAGARNWYNTVSHSKEGAI